MLIFPDEPRKIGPALKNLRQLFGVTQDELSAAGVGNQGVISAFENAHTMPLMPTVMAYLKALGYQLGATPIPEESTDERQQSEAPSSEVDEVRTQDSQHGNP